MDVRNLSRRPKRKREPLAASPDPESIPAHRAVGERLADTSVETTTGTGTISGPFTEVEGTRTYHATPETATSPDGLLVIEYYKADQVTMQDGDLNTVLFNYAESI